MSKNDPSVICRGKNLHLSSLKHFIAAIPKTAMPKAQFFAYAEQRMKGFQKTHSQIARQLGLYYCDAQGICHPRFTEDVSFDTIFKYGQYWARHYFVPNPFTKSFPQTCSPTCIYGYFLAHAEALNFDVDAIFSEMFGVNMADLDKAKSYLFNFTELTEVDDGKVSVPDECVRVDEAVLLQRDDEIAYYHYFDGWGMGGCGTPILVESSLRLFAKKVFVYLSEHEDGLQSVFSKCEQYSIASGEARLKIINSNPDVYLTGLFMHESQAHVNGANANDTHERWHADYDFQGLGGSNFLSGEWSLREYKENKPDVRLALTYPSFKRLVEWLYPKYEISKSDDDVFCFSRLKLQGRFAGNVLSTALGVFSERRQKLDWCADNTGGDANKPRMGFVANKMLRAAIPQTSNLNTDAKVAAWFKQYYNPDGKGWIDGDNTTGYAAFGGFIDYLVNGGTSVQKPQDFSRKLERAIKTVVEPAANAMYDARVNEVLKFLGLIGFDFKEDFDEDDYQDALHAQRVIKRRLKDMGEKRIVEWDAAANQAKPNDKDPDFLTVNEFLWFVKEHFKEINEEVVKMSVTPVQHQAYDKTKSKKKAFAADSAEDQLMLRILASLRTKPFVILAGHSGTGKSRMVKKLAYMTCRDNKLHEGSDPGNYCIIEVKPNWHDSTELLGYFSSFGHDHYVTKQLVEFIMKAYAYPDVPFFVCLDEMNLAPVEQYFAEFLSALEDIHVDEGKMNAFFGLNAANKPDGGAAQEVAKYTSAPLIKPIDYKDDIAMLEPKTTQAMDWLKTHGLTIPKNLFVVGTVNMDESTNQFSRKVLDRAFTIEMTDARFEDFGDEDKDPMPTFAKEDEIDHALIDNLLTGKKQAGKLSTRGTDTAQSKGQLENMNDLKGVLAGTPFVVAYRFANEYALYEDALNVLDVLEDGASETDKAAKKAANAKRAFDDAVLMKLLPRIAGERAVVAEIFEGRKATDKRGEKDGLLKFLEYDKEQKKGTASGEKMTEILNRGNVPYLTFWP